MKNKNIFLVVVVIGLVFLFSIFFYLDVFEKLGISKKDKVETNEATTEKFDFLIDGFPEDLIEFYELDYISASKFYVNTDPKNISTFDEKDFAYYNVVFKTKAPKEEVLNFYKEKFSKPIILEFSQEDSVYGYFGEYRVSVSHYGHDNNAYMQVHLPKNDPEISDKYFASFPAVFEKDDLLKQYETSFGYLNQKGGETEYTRYFEITNTGDANQDGRDDLDEYSYLYEKYTELYKNKDEYTADSATGTLKWKKNEQNVTLVISKDHGRIYLNIRELMK